MGRRCEGDYVIGGGESEEADVGEENRKYE
jgi:hypothetical protein